MDPGEHDVILLPLHLDADLVLIDEREGAEEARRLGLTVTGTLGGLEEHYRTPAPGDWRLELSSRTLSFVSGHFAGEMEYY